MPKSNAAQRLLAIATKINSIPDATATADGWAAVFEVKNDTQTLQDQAVVNTLLLLAAQLASTRAQLALKDVTTTAYSYPLSRVETALSPRLLPQPWSAVREKFNPETMAVLGLLPDFLDDDGSGFTEADCKTLTDELARLEALIEGETLPDDVKRFLRIQLSYVREAIRRSTIVGAEAFVTASDSAARDWLSASEIVGQYKDDPAVRAVWNLWPFIEKWGKRALILGGLAKFAYLDAPAILDRLQSLPGPKPPVQQLPGPAHPSKVEDDDLLDTGSCRCLTTA